MTRRTLYLYPGAHKTGTTLLQRALEIHRKRLEADNFAISRRQAYYRSGLHKMLLSDSANIDMDPASIDKILLEAFGRSPRKCDVVLSIENIFGEIGPKLYPSVDTVLKNLSRFFPEHEIVCTYYIRRQDTFIESAFVQSIQKGETLEFDAFFQPFRSHVLDWTRIIDALVRHLGRGLVRVIPFETIKNGSDVYITDFFSTFCDLTAEEVLAGTRHGLKDTNRTLSTVGIDVARAAFEVLPDMRERQRLVGLLQQEFGAGRYPPFRMPENIRHDIARTHQATNQHLVDRNFVAGDLAEYYLFHAGEPETKEAATEGAEYGRECLAQVGPAAATVLASSVGSECPICSSTDDYIEFRGRASEKCAKCGSLTRQRVMYLCLKDRGRLPEQLPQDRRRVAHFAPERALFRAFAMRRTNKTYKAFDLFPEKYKFAADSIEKLDLCRIDETIPPGSFDLVAHNHVLEHLPCPVPDIVASINRILGPDGLHVFSVPVRPGRFEEDLSLSISEQERKARFAQEDHMRIFGTEDAEDMFRTIFGRREVLFRLDRFLSRRDASRFGVEQAYEINAEGRIGGHSIFFYDASE